MEPLSDTLGSIRVAAVKADDGCPELLAGSMSPHRGRAFEEAQVGEFASEEARDGPAPLPGP